MNKSLPPPDCHHFEASIGWLELGNPTEALLELARIAPDLAEQPQVLEVKWQAFARLDHWERSLPVAQTFCQVAPSIPQGWLHQAVSLYRLNRTQEAWDLLRPMADRFPRSWIVSYDLSCYACQLGRLDEGRLWLKKAFTLGNAHEVQALALADPDLKSLWREILELPLPGKQKRTEGAGSGATEPAAE